MYEKERFSVKMKLDKEILQANGQIEKLGFITDVVAPESSLGDVVDFMNKEEVNQQELKFAYRKKRKLMFMLENIENINSFLCSTCGKEIGIERLLIMPKARLCGSCVISS